MSLSAGSSLCSKLAVCVPAIALSLFCLVGTAFSSDDIEEQDLEKRTRTERRAEGLAFIDLPMRLRARFDVAYSDDLYLSDTLARPFVSAAGPGIRDDESFESLFAITRSISDKVEVGIVWAARSPVRRINVFDFDRQTIGAMIRIVP